jgi:uncharacterized protein
VTTDGGKVHYGVARVDLHLPAVDNLKGKRALLNRLKATLRSELDCSVAEVGAQDLWQRAVIGIAVAASTATGVDRVLDRITAVIERDPRLVVLGVSELGDHLEGDGPGIDPSDLG